MLERLTNGRYLSALHRAKNLSARERLSLVLFLDPSFDARLQPLPGVVPDTSQPHTNVRWDRIDPHAMQGTYGEYLLSKVSKVFLEQAPAVWEALWLELRANLAALVRGAAHVDVQLARHVARDLLVRELRALRDVPRAAVAFFERNDRRAVLA